MESKWNRNGIEMESKWNRNGIEMESKWNRAVHEQPVRRGVS